MYCRPECSELKVKLEPETTSFKQLDFKITLQSNMLNIVSLNSTIYLLFVFRNPWQKPISTYPKDIAQYHSTY